MNAKDTARSIVEALPNCGAWDGAQLINYIQSMPRKARLFVPGCVHHGMARGLDGIDIFVDDADRQIFLEL